ncbi:MAG: hypothetical protein ABFS38_05165 [Bacteroidota bacterium]
MRYILVLTGIVFCCSSQLTAQQEYQPTYEDTLQVFEELFNYEDPLHLAVKCDLKTFKKTRRQEKYQPAEMTCHVNDSFQVTHPVRIKARGIFRRDKCDLPPFWLNIRYSGIEADSLKEIRKIKMVIRCGKSKQYENYILREYMVYKIYNLISPYSFRVRLVKLKLINTAKENIATEDWAFMIEPADYMARRLNAVFVKSDKLSVRTVNREMIDKVALFQYMIGNGDFSVTGRHNLRILTLKDQAAIRGFVPVPYDFDISGLVNAHYAIPGEHMGTKSVRERYFLGPCRSRDMHQEAIQNFATYKDEIIDYIHGFEYLDEKEKLDMIVYIESYFEEASDEKFIDRHLSTTCL